MRYLYLVLPVLAGMIIFQACSDDEESVQTRITRLAFDTSVLTEGDAENTQVITVTATGEFGDPVSLSYRVEAGNASAGDDFTAASGELTFSSAERSAEIPLTILGDTYFELSETVALVVNNGSSEVVHTVSIRNDDEMSEILEDADGFFTPETYPSMRPIWSDEFNAAALNASDWNYELGDGCDRGICGWGNDELQRYTDNDQNILLEDGRLIITARESVGNYTSARITTQDKQEIQFGRIDIRARLPKGQGIWPALWMLGANIDQVSWPACGEIDIMELVGHEPDKVHGTVHYDNGGYKSESGSYSLSSGDFSDKYHVFTLVWDRDEITWYVDNQQLDNFRKTGSGTYPFNSPFFFIFNVAVGGRWPGDPDETTVFPQAMEVDYIRVFR